jgi:hypothetical protein
MRWRRALIAAALLVVGDPATGRAGNNEDLPAIDTSACDSESATRLQWLTERLDSRERYADLWWRGWTGFYGIGAVVQGAQAGVEDDRGKRADYIVSAVKAVGGTTRLYFSRPVARLGADPLRAEALADDAACRARVEEGEALLRQAAHESTRRWDWKAHFFNVALNMAGAVIVTEGFDENEGWTSAGVGIAVGEAMLWSHPWRGKSDLAEYEARFERTAAMPMSWAVLPYERGFRVQVRF